MNSFYQKFASYYESEYGLDARKKIIQLGIKDIIFYKNSVEIHLERPGLLIGPKCENIKKLEEFITPYNIKIVEANSPAYNILNCLNDRCFMCSKEIHKEYKCEDLSSDANFCSEKCRDEYIKEQSLWE